MGKLVPVLEENPKWRLLRKVLTEIDETETKRRKQSKAASSFTQQTTVLVMVKDDRTVDAVRSYLVEGRDQTMTRRWLNYLDHYNDRSRSVTDSNISEESRLLLEEESRVRRVLVGKGEGRG